MTTQQHAIDQADIRQRVDTLIEAIRAMDVERMRPLFAADLVSFDIEPPLRHLGAEAKWKNWEKAFAVYQHPLGYETHGLTITVGGDVAFVHSLNRISGTLKNGTSTGTWVRWTAGLRKIDGDWLIVHDQVSVPTDFETGAAVLDLEP